MNNSQKVLTSFPVKVEFQGAGGIIMLLRVLGPPWVLTDHVQSRPPRGMRPIGSPCGPDPGSGVDVANHGVAGWSIVGEGEDVDSVDDGAGA